MTAAATTTSELTLRWEVSDPYDASIRLLNDAQRFGLQLVSLCMASEKVLTLTIRVPVEADRNNLVERFRRHRAVVPILPSTDNRPLPSRA